MNNLTSSGKLRFSWGESLSMYPARVLLASVIRQSSQESCAARSVRFERSWLLEVKAVFLSRLSVMREMVAMMPQ